MAQPDYVPLAASDKVRPPERLPVPDGWVADRPAEVSSGRHPSGRSFGSPGPDQGYALKLARRFEDRLQLQRGEHAADAVAGCLTVALKRAALFGRAPVIYDLELAFTLFGFLGDAPDTLLRERGELFGGASHDYFSQRAIADLVPEPTLRLSPAQVRERLAEWRSLLSPVPG